MSREEIQLLTNKQLRKKTKHFEEIGDQESFMACKEEAIVRKSYNHFVNNAKCGTKIQYETIEAANECIKELIEKRKIPANSKGMRPYPCYFCKKFHVGTIGK